MGVAFCRGGVAGTLPCGEYGEDAGGFIRREKNMKAQRLPSRAERLGERSKPATAIL